MSTNTIILVIFALMLAILTSKRFKKKLSWKEKKKLGDEFENHVVNHYKKLGYTIDHRGKKLGRKDGGIDIIATKENEIILIQCKNYLKENSINQKDIRAFNGDCYTYAENNNLDLAHTKFKFIVSNKRSLDNGAVYYCQDKNNRCETETVTV
jgi:restriction system protein